MNEPQSATEQTSEETKTNNTSVLNGTNETLSKKILNDVNAYCAGVDNEGFKTRLGASKIGEKCWRKLWFGFRWVSRETFDGRVARLLERGDLEESRFVKWLRGIGCTVYDKDDNGKQFAVSSKSGHAGSRVDGVVYLPESYKVEVPFLAEFKTNGTGAGFTKTVSDGVQQQKPLHWAQICFTGYEMGINHALYGIVNKNDDDLSFEVKDIDMKHGMQLHAKAEAIIHAQQAPERMDGAKSKAFLDCKMCNHKDICWNGAPLEKNCRSCEFGKAVDNGVWFCQHHKDEIPKHVIPVGCDAYKKIY